MVCLFFFFFWYVFSKLISPNLAAMIGAYIDKTFLLF